MLIVSPTAGNAAAPGELSAAPFSYIKGLDGLRAIAVMFVLIAHAGFGKYVPGGFGVTIFFTISGYLITSLLLNEIARTGSIELKLFYARRILRLYPELLFFVILCFLTSIFLPFRATLPESISVLFYFMNYYYVFGAHYPEVFTFPWRQLWSLAVEEHFYIFFPCLLFLFKETRKYQTVTILFLIIAPFFWRFCTYYVMKMPWQYNYVATDTRIDSIAWGCLLAILLQSTSEYTVKPQTSWFIRPEAVFIGIIIIILTLGYRSEDFRWTWRFTLQGMALALLIGNLLLDPRWRSVVNFLELRPLRFIGRISYGLYLYHMLLNRIILENYPTLSQSAYLSASLVASISVATISYFAIEVPLKAIRRRLGSHVR